MFTGIVQHLGSVSSMESHEGGARLSIDRGTWSMRHRLGDSIAVSGVCLTLAAERGTELVFDVIQETLRKTTLGERHVGDAVNLEASLRLETPLGGHFVQGHIDAIGTVDAVENTSSESRIRVSVSADVLPFLTPTGGISIEGVSLTIAQVDIEKALFDVALIPTTLDATTLGKTVAGDRLNIETDILARSIVHNMRLK
jgi:riboflavin synthase alpha subunit